MKFARLLPVMVFAALLFSAAFAAAAEVQQVPRIYIAEPKYDLGTVTEGDIPEHDFEIKNEGSALLIIQRLQPS